MRVLLTGASGQLAADLKRVLGRQAGIKLYPLTRADLDITNRDRVLETVAAIRPGIILHPAAYTRVDECEQNPAAAYKVNAAGTSNLAEAAENCRAGIVYFSTDYVFDGQARKPYEEQSPTAPVNVYGASKLAGEEAVKAISSRFFIIRTAWLYGRHGNNFVKTILQLAGNRKELTVVDDQVGCPTFSHDLAMFVNLLIRSDAYGVYHATNTGKCSWYEFAGTILKEFSINNVSLMPIKTIDLNRPARRPAYSVLGHRALLLNGFPLLPAWQDGLHRFNKSYPNP